jgi:hypothetical protein
VSQEIWAMYQISAKGKKSQISNLKTQNYNLKLKDNKLIPKKLKIISAWRYPGVSPKKNPIPEEILREIGSII